MTQRALVLVSTADLLDQRKCVLHSNDHERLGEELLVESEWNGCANRNLLSLLREQTLLVHLVELLLLSDNLLVPEESEKFPLWNLILALCVQLVAPNVIYQLLVLLQAVAQVLLVVGCICWRRVISSGHAANLWMSGLVENFVGLQIVPLLILGAESLADSEAVDHL